MNIYKWILICMICFILGLFMGWVVYGNTIIMKSIMMIMIFIIIWWLILTPNIFNK